MEENKTKTPEKAKGKTDILLLRRIVSVFVLLFLIVYLITVALSASAFFDESSEKNSLLRLERDAQEADRLMGIHFNNLYGIADRLSEVGTKEETDDIIREYIGRDEFGTLRYLANDTLYDPYGGEILSGVEYDLISDLANNREVATTEIYTYHDYGDCIALFVPVKVSGYAEGIIAIIPVRGMINPTTLLNETASAVAVVMKDGKIVASKTASAFTQTLGNNFFTFTADFINDKPLEKSIYNAIQGDQNTSIQVNPFGQSYHVAVAPIDAVGGNLMLVSISESQALIASEMTFVRHIIIVLSLAIIAFVVTIVYSVLYHKKAKEALSAAILTDARLGCPNAEQFRRQAQETLNNFSKRDFAIMVYDTRRFKYLLDEYGEEKMNEILKFVAKVFGNFCAEGECYGYAGDGRFLLMSRLKSEKSIKDKIRLINSIINEFALLKANNHTIKFNIGVYMTTDGRRKPIGEMIDCAAVASETARGNINALYVPYTNEANAEIERSQRIEAQMESSLENGEFKLFLQPKYNVKLDKIDSAEALVRWFDPRKGEYMFPGEFIGLFETNGFITKLDKFIYIEVLKYLSSAAERGDAIVPISVNVSRVTAMSDDFLEFYTGNKKKYGIGDGFITLELTESFAMENYGKINDIVNTLRANGMRSSIDDFGAGYSSFNLLKRIKVDEIKLDRIFLSKGADRQRDDMIFEAVMNLVQSLDMKVVQEGVENEEMFNYVVSRGCQIIQGYYYAKAIPLEEYRIFLNSNTSIKYKAKVK